MPARCGARNGGSSTCKTDAENVPYHHSCACEMERINSPLCVAFGGERGARAVCVLMNPANTKKGWCRCPPTQPHTTNTHHIHNTPTKFKNKNSRSAFFPFPVCLCFRVTRGLGKYFELQTPLRVLSVSRMASNMQV